MSTTHIAGPVIVIDGRAIQRCQVCGEKLVDSKGQMAPTNPDGSAPRVLTWKVGGLVQQDGNYWASVPGEPGDSPEAPGKYPKDGCLDLVE